MLSSLGSGPTGISIESFFSVGISEPNLSHLNRAGAAPLFGQALEVGGKCGLHNVCRCGEGNSFIVEFIYLPVKRKSL